MKKQNWLTSVLVIAWLTLLSGCASAPPRERVAQANPATLGELAASTALAKVGAPYRYGGMGPKNFDCSGLVHYAYSRVGVEVPRTAAAQLRASQRVGVDSLRPGDLLFFDIEGKISHVALYTGDSRFVHAPSSGKTVSTGGLDHPYWRSRLVAAGRLQ